MKTKIIILCPTRDRPDMVAQLTVASFNALPHPNSRLVLVIPEEQRALYGDQDALYHPFTGITGITPPANWAIQQVWNDCEYVAIVGDDHKFVTPDWEAQVLKSLEQSPVVLTNDLYNTLGGTIFVSAKVVRALGWWFMPECRHLYVDNVQSLFGKALGAVDRRDVVIEHVHPFAGKRPMDDLTRLVNTSGWYDDDGKAFNDYVNTRFRKDVENVRRALAE